MIRYSYRYFRTRPRLVAGILFGVLAYFVLHFLADSLQYRFTIAKIYANFAPITEFIIAWNIGVWVYLGSIFYMMAHSTVQKILSKAKTEDEGTKLMVILTLLTAVISMLAIIQELGVSKDDKGVMMVGHLMLTLMTIITAWLFIHTMFAVHYAHHYYLVKFRHHPHHANTDNPSDTYNKAQTNPDQNKQTQDVETLDFPHDDQPDYWDFLYFSYIIGTSAQTADVEFTHKGTRRLGTIHCVLAFFFNVAILSLMINLASGLFGN